MESQVELGWTGSTPGNPADFQQARAGGAAHRSSWHEVWALGSTHPGAVGEIWHLVKARGGLWAGTWWAGCGASWEGCEGL